MPKNSDDLFDFLTSLDIKFENHEHEAVFTVAESNAMRGETSGGHTKNLFIKDKKGRHFLLTVGHHAEIDLKSVHQLIGGQGRVSFGRPEAMMDYLGVVPGSVTAFGVINDADKNVTLIFDEALMENDAIHCHPLRNTATTTISVADMKRFVEATGHDYLVLKLSGQDAT